MWVNAVRKCLAESQVLYHEGNKWTMFTETMRLQKDDILVYFLIAFIVFPPKLSFYNIWTYEVVFFSPKTKNKILLPPHTLFNKLSEREIRCCFNIRMNIWLHVYQVSGTTAILVLFFFLSLFLTNQKCFLCLFDSKSWRLEYWKILKLVPDD